MNRRSALRAGLAALAAAVPQAAFAQTGGQAATPPAAKPPPPPIPAPFRLKVEPKAVEIVKAAATKLGAAKAMAFSATVSYEAPSRLGPPLLYTVRYDTVFARPDKLRVITVGDGPASEFVYDGKQVMAYAPAEDMVAVADASPNIEDAMRSVYENAGIYFPFIDLLLPDPYQGLSEGVNLAFYIGQSNIVGGTRTDMVAWADNDLFMQLWIGAEDKLPRRMRAMFRNDPLRLRHDMELSGWQIDPAQTATAASPKAQAGKRIPFVHPADPPPAPQK